MIVMNVTAFHPGMRIYILATRFLANQTALFAPTGSFNLSLDFSRNTHSIFLQYLWSRGGCRAKPFPRHAPNLASFQSSHEKKR
jgi:hypothetical protein